MKKIFVVFAIIVCFVIISFSSCNVDTVDSELPPFDNCIRPYLSSFHIKNPDSGNLIPGIIGADSTIVFYLPKIESADSLVCIIEGYYKDIYLKDSQYSQSYDRLGGVITLDTTKCLVLYNEKGDSCLYNVYVSKYNCLPRLFINTEDSSPIISKTDWVNAEVKIDNALWFDSNDWLQCKVRGRGNASWTHLKKPYIIKIAEKCSILGMPSNKKWILLAENYDYSLLRTAFMNECAKALNMDNIFRYEYIELYINESYYGTYLVAEKVENKKGRVEVDKDGFILEEDNWYAEEPCYITINRDSLPLHFSFKYPDAGDGDIQYGDDSYLFILDYMKRVTSSILELSTDSNSEKYLEYVDVESFAKWYITMEVTGNRDPNRYYILKNRSSKLKMYPVWDAEWSMGIQPPTAWGPPPLTYYDQLIWTELQYFPHLFKSPIFVEEVKKQWFLFKTKILEIEESIRSIKNRIKYTQEDNFNRWVKNPVYRPSVYFETWEEEVNYVEEFFKKRIEWMDKRLN